MDHGDHSTIGTVIAQRLKDAGLKTFFSVPGDYNLLLLDSMIGIKGLRMIGCCNELNAAYAADGYARKTGFAVVVTTYMVGGLSAINAIAGSFAEDVPVMIISGAPSTIDEQEYNIVHHTNGKIDYNQQASCFQPISHRVFQVRSPDNATYIINSAIRSCMYSQKPVYLEISCNLIGEKLYIPQNNAIEFPSTHCMTSPSSLSAATSCLLDIITKSVKPVLLGGRRIQSKQANKLFLQLANKVQMAVAMMPDAKGQFPENNPLYIGTYWGPVSRMHCSNIVESSDLCIAVGPVFSDYTTAGWNTLLLGSKVVTIQSDYMDICGSVFTDIDMCDVLDALIEAAPVKTASIEAYRRIHTVSSKTDASYPISTAGVADCAEGSEASSDTTQNTLRMHVLQQHLQGLVEEAADVVVDVGNAWFVGQELQLRPDTSFHIQMQYASTGWSIGAALGMAASHTDNAALKVSPSVVVVVGDGAFQMCFQEISTLIRHNCNVKMIVMNNGGYTIDVEIHDGPYNKLKNWHYAELLDVFRPRGGEGDRNSGRTEAKSVKVTTCEQMQEAVRIAKLLTGFVLIECVLAVTDCVPALYEWGSRIGAYVSRPF